MKFEIGDSVKYIMNQNLDLSVHLDKDRGFIFKIIGKKEFPMYKTTLSSIKENFNLLESEIKHCRIVLTEKTNKRFMQ